MSPDLRRKLDTVVSIVKQYPRDELAAVHKFCSMLPAFEFQARPVIPVEEAIRVEREAIAWRNGLKGS